MKPDWKIAVIAAAASFFLPAPSLAAGKLAVTVNTLPEVCDPLVEAFRENPEYLLYDPDAPNIKFAHAGPLAGTWDSIDLPEKGSGAHRLSWDEELSGEIVYRESPERYDLLRIEGSEYSSTYVVYSGYGYLHSFAAPVRFYKFVPRSQLSPRRLPEVFLAENNSPLSKAVNALAANDLLTKGWRSYPVVRRPGHVSVYEVGEKPGATPVEYKAEVACDIWAAPALEKAVQGLPAAAPQQAPVSKKYAVCDSYAGFPDVYATCQQAQARLFHFSDIKDIKPPKPKSDFVYNR
ncbi:MAG: hypothetical protein EPN97_03420 [Alphaproteobacteria bacterium]|nr:MAG: hypothetical protein EPN97_03420 [Alphaproteobacteria bacterium]